MNVSEVKNKDWSIDPNVYGGILQGIDDIGGCIGNILTTAPGSVPGDLEFGCDIYQDIDKNVSEIPKIVKKIADAVGKYEQRVVLTKIAYMLVFENSQYVVRFFLYWTTDIKFNGSLQVFANDSEQVGFNYTFDFQLG